MELIYLKINKQLEDIKSLLIAIDKEDYTNKIIALGDSSIGQHVRHIIEIFYSLTNFHDSGEINYDKRDRDIRIETNPSFAIENLDFIIKNMIKADKDLVLIVEDCEKQDLVKTNYKRELHYNLEHTIHHMALIKVALSLMEINLTDDCFGLAYATIEYRKTQVK